MDRRLPVPVLIAVGAIAVTATVVLLLPRRDPAPAAETVAPAGEAELTWGTDATGLRPYANARDIDGAPGGTASAATEADTTFLWDDLAEDRDDTLDEEPFLDEEQLAELIEAADGNIVAVYRNLKLDHRMDLVDYLWDEESLRLHIGDLLLIETDSELRAYMLARVDPIGMFDDEYPEDHIDEDLLSLLDQHTRTPIGAEEWMTRLMLVNSMSPEAMVELVRALQPNAYPSNPEVQLTADSMMLIVGGGVDSVTAAELGATSARIQQALADPGAMDRYPPEDRMRAYMALVMSPDDPGLGQFLREQLARETDPTARQVLESVLGSVPPVVEVPQAPTE